MSATVALPLNARVEREFVDVCAPICRIVTVHSGSLRELLFTLPALRALRETFEGARIASVVREGLAPLLKSCSLVDEVLARPEGGLSSQAHLMAKLHGEHSDVAISFSSSRNGVLLAWSSGAHIRLGFDGAKMDALLTHRVAREASTPAVIEDYLDLTRALGCAPRCHDYCDLIRPSVQSQSEVTQWLCARGIAKEFILLAPQPETKIKRSPREAEKEVERWAKAALLLARRAPVVLLASRPQRALVAALREYSAESQLNIFDAGGAFDPSAQAAISHGARCFVGYTGGAMHLAAAMSTPVVALRAARQKPGRESEFCEADEPRGVTQRMLPEAASPEEIAHAALELIGL
jgi:ADP-heptose:LPS heptosyltransferase